MASFAPIKGTKQEIENTPLVDGQFLVETDQGDQNKTYIDSYDANNVLQRTMCGGGGHEILPTPDTTEPTGGWEYATVSAINAADSESDKIVSLWGMGNWSNTMTKRVVYNGTLSKGASGIGEWLEDEDLDTLRAKTETDRAIDEEAYGWWYDDHFLHLDQAIDPVSGTTVVRDDYDLNFKFEPKETGEIITLGGYILDTDTGYMCIKFGNRLRNAGNKVAVDITINNNNTSYSGS